MSFMYVFRVECSTSQLGIYVGGSSASSNMMGSEQHPTPKSDDRLMQELHDKSLGHIGTDNHNYGFSHRTQMRRWISNPRWKRSLRRDEYDVLVLKVPKHKVAIGATQVIFDRDEAVVVSRFCPTKI